MSWWPFKTKKELPKKLSSSNPVINERPLYEQFGRIGGGLTPREVSAIIRSADCGRPARLFDVYHEGREKDGHLQSICSTREGAVGLCKLRFVEPNAPETRETEETKLCRRVVDDFENWPVLLEHLSGSFVAGHATCVLDWKKTKDGFLLPYRTRTVPEREFILSQENGKLLYDVSGHGDEAAAVDLLAQNPGRVVQILRRINGDVLAREGLIRVLVWAALFRNWSLRDWLALGEIGWKPWRIGVYQKGSGEEDIDGLVKMLERIGSAGVGIIPDTTDVRIEWPTSNRASASGDHQLFFITLGREMSKAVLGTTSSVEEATLGDRAATQTRDQLRVDIRKRDAIIISSYLRTQLFAYVIAVNLGENRPVPVPWFQADDARDMLTFSEAVRNMSLAGLRLGQRWVRGEFGAPEPEDGEEVIGTNAKAPGARAADEDPEMKPEAPNDGSGDQNSSDPKKAA